MKTIIAAIIITVSSTSMAATKCGHRLSNQGGLFQTTNAQVVSQVKTVQVANTATEAAGVR